MADTEADFVIPRPAATVVVVRQSDPGPEVLMVKRHHRAAFASSYVFPGGVLEPDDELAMTRCDHVTDDDANVELGIDCDGLCYYSAAFREVLEETGVLLASASVATDIDTSSIRDGLNDGSLRWIDFLERFDLRLPCELLHYVAYWVTPRTEPKRFSTRFFVAEMPEGQSALHDGGELTDSCWVTPADALRAGRAGEMKLPYVTRSTLRDIEQFDDVSQIVDWAKSRVANGLAKKLPAFVTVDGKDLIVMPDSPHYPDEFER